MLANNVVFDLYAIMPFLLGYSSLVARRPSELLVSNVKFAWSWTKLTTCVREVLFKFIIVKFEFP